MAKKRKTREQKVIAKLRRELKEARRELKRFKKEKTSKKKRIEKSQTLVSYAPSSNLYFRKDLTKTLILSILAIAIELVVYWLTTTGFDIFNLPAHLKTKFS